MSCWGRIESLEGGRTDQKNDILKKESEMLIPDMQTDIKVELSHFNGLGRNHPYSVCKWQAGSKKSRWWLLPLFLSL